MLRITRQGGAAMAEKQQLTDTQINKVFHDLGLSDSTTPVAPQPSTPPSTQPIYFPLSADSVSIKENC
jgi:hypothetical protein